MADATTPLTFAQLKAAFIANARPLEFCKGLYMAQNATDANSLIQSNIDAAIWLYTAGIATDDLLAQLDQSALNANGIYFTGTFNLTNPVGTVYVLGPAIVTLTANGTNATELHALGTGNVILNLADTAFCELGAYLGANVTITAGDNSTLCLTTYEQAVTNITLNGNANAALNLNWFSSAVVTGNDNSFANVRGYDKSVFSPTMNGTATYQFLSYDGATKTVTDPNQ